MQKLVYIIMILVVTACHKDFAKTTVINDKPVVLLALKETISAGEFQQLDIHQMEAVSVNETLVGYKIPFATNTDTRCVFVFVNMHQHQVGTIYKNDITYVPLHGGMYPQSIINHNYETGATAAYQTGVSGQRQFALPVLQSSPKELSNPAHAFDWLPPVTSSGVYNRQNDNSETLSSINTYILSALLGIESLAFQESSAHMPGKYAHYFNPKSAGVVPGNSSPAWLSWDIKPKQ